MPLIIRKPSKTVVAIAEAAVNDAFAPPEIGGLELAAVAARPTLSEPHPVYNIGLDEVLKGRQANLSAAQQTGWRYLVSQGGNTLAATEVDQPRSRGEALFSNISEGGFAMGTSAAIVAAKQFDELKQGAYELRVLRIPALYVMALWLHSTGQDLLIPISSGPAVGGTQSPGTPEGVVVNQKYDPGDFFQRLQSQAEVLARFESQSGNAVAGAPATRSRKAAKKSAPRSSGAVKKKKPPQSGRTRTE
jgi:hypothetical protein